MLLLRRLAPGSPASRERDADSTPPSRAADSYPGACRPGLSRTRLPCQDRSRIHRNLKSLGGGWVLVGVLVYCHSPLRRRFLPLSASPRCRHCPCTPSPSQLSRKYRMRSNKTGLPGPSTGTSGPRRRRWHAPVAADCATQADSAPTAQLKAEPTRTRPQDSARDHHWHGDSDGPRPGPSPGATEAPTGIMTCTGSGRIMASQLGAGCHCCGTQISYPNRACRPPSRPVSTRIATCAPLVSWQREARERAPAQRGHLRILTEGLECQCQWQHSATS